MSPKRTSAAVLKYEVGRDAAPRLVAKGYGEIARRIIELARQHQLPVIQDAALAALLMKLEVDETIPATLFQVVAEVYAFLMQLEGRP